MPEYLVFQSRASASENLSIANSSRGYPVDTGNYHADSFSPVFGLPDGRAAIIKPPDEYMTGMSEYEIVSEIDTGETS